MTAWQSAKQPPNTDRRVMLRFDDDGSRDASGLYSARHGAYFYTRRAMEQQRAVHPIQWRELSESDDG